MLSSNDVRRELMRSYREFVLHYFALAMQKGYNLMIRVPKFVLMIITGALGSVIMGLLHRGKPAAKAPAKPAPKTPAVKAVGDGTRTPTGSPAKKGSVKAKKGGKK